MLPNPISQMLLQLSIPSRTTLLLNRPKMPLSMVLAPKTYTANEETDCAIGPVGVAVKEQTEKTGNDISSLANARTEPSEPAATGQPLTSTAITLAHRIRADWETDYHSFFYSLLSVCSRFSTGKLAS